MRRMPGRICKTWLTVILIPRIVGCPPQTSGMTVMRSICMKLYFYKDIRGMQSDPQSLLAAGQYLPSLHSRLVPI